MASSTSASIRRAAGGGITPAEPRSSRCARSARLIPWCSTGASAFSSANPAAISSADGGPAGGPADGRLAAPADGGPARPADGGPAAPADGGVADGPADGGPGGGPPARRGPVGTAVIALPPAPRRP